MLPPRRRAAAAAGAGAACVQEKLHCIPSAEQQTGEHFGKTASRFLVSTLLRSLLLVLLVVLHLLRLRISIYISICSYNFVLAIVLLFLCASGHTSNGVIVIDEDVIELYYVLLSNGDVVPLLDVICECVQQTVGGSNVHSRFIRGRNVFRSTSLSHFMGLCDISIS